MSSVVINTRLSSPSNGVEYDTVSTYADLPDAAAAAGETYVVLSSTGVWLINRKSAGLYYSDGATWAWIGDMSSSSIKSLYEDNADTNAFTDAEQTKLASFPTDGNPASFTLVYSGANQSNVTVNRAVWWRERGGYLSMEIHVEFTGAAGTGSVWTIDLPIVSSSQLTIDTARTGGGTSTTGAGRSHFGFANWFQAGAGWKNISVQYESSSKLRFAEAPGYVTDNQLTNSGGNNSAIKIHSLRIPITGWT